MSDAQGSGGEPSDLTNECPICGQEYDHKRTDRSGFEPETRPDVRECKTAEIGNDRTVYVHV